MTRVIVTSPVWSLNGVNVFSANLVRGLRSSGFDARIRLTGVSYRERKPMPVPADIPVEQPKKFEFVKNIKAANQIGLTIPQSVLYRSTKVIK